jgi:type I restriction enzyme, R subunit
VDAGKARKGMYVDRRLGGIQAVQTLSRLNRAYRDQNSIKDATFVVDFVNEPAGVLTAFQQYHVAAELADISDPHVILDLRSKLDTAGRYDRIEVDRVAQVVVTPKSTQGNLDAALVPVSSRLLLQFQEAQKAHQAHPEGRQGPPGRRGRDGGPASVQEGPGQLHTATPTFLGQMFDYGNTYREQLYMFAKLLLPLLDYRLEREGLDLSALKLTHHKMRDLGQ